MKSEDKADVAILGAGLIGLSIAWRLAQRGASVRVFDTGEPVRAASWAGAGMLAPFGEAFEDGALFELCAWSLELYPGYVEELRACGGVDARLHVGGHIGLAFDESELEQLKTRAERMRASGYRAELLGRREVLELEPSVASGVTGGLLVPGDGQVDNRRLGRALVAACRAAGVRFTRAGSIAVECTTRRVTGLRVSEGFVAASVVVNAAGAWAASIPGVPPAARIPVYPVKGQMTAFAIPRSFLRRVVWHRGTYLVPRADGRLLVGATTEHVGFDVRVTAGGVAQLLAGALRAAPALAGFTLCESWAGLRPGSHDGRPYLGPTPLEGYFVAAGHYRNGILLAPATGAIVAGLIGGRSSPIALEPFLPTRADPRRKLEERVAAAAN